MYVAVISSSRHVGRVTCLHVCKHMHIGIQSIWICGHVCASAQIAFLEMHPSAYMHNASVVKYVCVCIHIHIYIYIYICMYISFVTEALLY